MCSLNPSFLFFLLCLYIPFLSSVFLATRGESRDYISTLTVHPTTPFSLSKSRSSVVLSSSQQFPHCVVSGGIEVIKLCCFLKSVME